MTYEGSPEPIDFDFFAEDDEDIRSAGRNSSRHSTTTLTPATNQSSRPVSASSRPVSASSARSLSSRSSISVKIPSAGPTGVRENAYTFKSRSDSSDDEDNYAVKLKGSRPSRYENLTKVEPNKDAVVNRPIGNEEGSGGEGDSLKKASSSRPKTSKGPHSGRTHRQRDRSSSSDSKSSKSQHSSSSFSSKSEHSDSYTSISDSDSDVTDVSPLPSPARSPIPRLEYDQDDFEDSFEESRFLQAKEQSSSTSNGNGRLNKKRNRKKESVRFAAVTPNNNGSSSQRDKQMDETEARELSRLLRAVLQLEETPNHSQMNSFHRSPVKQRPSSAKRAPTSTAAMPHQRVNLSFSNDKVRQIDRENQRLLQKILRRPKSAVAAPGLAPSIRKQNDQLRMTSHSSIRRQREQRKIDMENRKILQRIESAHASATVERTSLLHDHDRQMKYASQVSKGSMRPISSRNTGHNYSGSLSKGSSLASLNSEASRTSTASTGSRRMRPSSGRSMPPPPQGPRQAWEDRW